MSAHQGRHAVVIGGSLGGLCAARVLSERFETVSLIERDVFADTAEARRGVPQGRHLHALLRRGQDLLEGWFPGLTSTLLNGGAVPLEFGMDVRWYHFGGWKVEAPSGVVALALSRPFLELEVRRRVLAIPNIKLLDGHDVGEFSSDSEKRRVTGVLVRRKADEAVFVLSADLVVDASGRGSATPRLLQALGRPAVEESFVKVNVGYASREYERGANEPAKATYILGRSPESKRLGAIFPIEGGRWIAVLAGSLGDHPPADEAEFLNFAKALPSPELWEILRKATPRTAITRYTFAAHQRRHYERMRDFPDGLMVLGDAHCSFNPIYGQGISTAALSVAELETMLKKPLGAGASSRFQAKIAKVVDDPWMMSTGEDFRFPEVEGSRPFWNGMMQWFTAKVHQASLHDPLVARQFYRAMHMLDGPASFTNPRFLYRVFRGQATAAPRALTVSP